MAHFLSNNVVTNGSEWCLCNFSFISASFCFIFCPSTWSSFPSKFSHIVTRMMTIFSPMLILHIDHILCIRIVFSETERLTRGHLCPDAYLLASLLARVKYIVDFLLNIYLTVFVLPPNVYTHCHKQIITRFWRHEIKCYYTRSIRAMYSHTSLPPFRLNLAGAPHYYRILTYSACAYFAFTWTNI